MIFGAFWSPKVAFGVIIFKCDRYSINCIVQKVEKLSKHLLFSVFYKFLFVSVWLMLESQFQAAQDPIKH